MVPDSFSYLIGSNYLILPKECSINVWSHYACLDWTQHLKALRLYLSGHYYLDLNKIFTFIHWEERDLLTGNHSQKIFIYKTSHWWWWRKYWKSSWEVFLTKQVRTKETVNIRDPWLNPLIPLSDVAWVSNLVYENLSCSRDELLIYGTSSDSENLLYRHQMPRNVQNCQNKNVQEQKLGLFIDWFK